MGESRRTAGTYAGSAVALCSAPDSSEKKQERGDRDREEEKG